MLRPLTFVPGNGLQAPYPAVEPTSAFPQLLDIIPGTTRMASSAVIRFVPRKLTRPPTRHDLVTRGVSGNV